MWRPNSLGVGKKWLIGVTVVKENTGATQSAPACTVVEVRRLALEIQHVMNFRRLRHDQRHGARFETMRPGPPFTHQLFGSTVPTITPITSLIARIASACRA